MNNSKKDIIKLGSGNFPSPVVVYKLHRFKDFVNPLLVCGGDEKHRIVGKRSSFAADILFGPESSIVVFFNKVPLVDQDYDTLVVFQDK